MFIIRFSFFFSSFTNNYQFFEISSSQLPFFLSSQSEEKKTLAGFCQKFHDGPAVAPTSAQKRQERTD